MCDNRWSLINVKTNDTIQIERQTTRAGRNKDDEIICKSTAVSRHHANFILLDERLYVQDNRVWTDQLFSININWLIFLEFEWYLCK